MKSNTIRRRHTNSKLGCLNCKKKKIRCDENVPECKNCQKSRKNICSYLSLTPKELNKVRLAHALRTSTNKLLSSNYRLPTSDIQDQIFIHDLEFKHELTDLPIRIPNFMYPPLQFKPVSVKELDDSNDTESLPDILSKSATSTPSPVMSPGCEKIPKTKPLPGAIISNREFSIPNYLIKITPHIGINEYQFTKRVDLDYLILYMKNQQKSKYSHIINDLLILLGASIVISVSKNPSLRSFCLEQHSHNTRNLQRYNDVFDSKRDITMVPILYYSYSFLGYCNLLLGFSLKSCVKISSTAIQIMEKYLKINKNKPKGDIYKVILNELQYEMLFINMPSYKPSYLDEVMENIKELSLIYDSLPENFTYIKELFIKLFKFVKNDYLPVLSHGDNDKVIEYPIEMVYNLLKNWLKIFPSGAFVPICLNKGNQYEVLKSNLTSTVYCYYYLIGASLRTTFPFIKYVLGFSFPTLELNGTREFFEVSSILNSYGTSINVANLQDLLQRHNYYALRIYSFFRHRARIFIKHVDWDPSYFIPNLNANRWFKNVNEVPIESFKYTLVRPEHYPSITELDKGPGHKFTRTDETMILKLYARNIETLKFFDSQYVLQFDYQSMALLRDYRPMSAKCITDFEDLTPTDLEFFRNYKDHLIPK